MLHWFSDANQTQNQGVIMRTWWIIRTTDGLRVWGYYSRVLTTRSIGPYWTREEAEHILDLWS